MPTFVAAFLLASSFFNVRDYGASGGGISKDTAAIHKAIDACVKTGGGTILFPPGKYLTGAINLKSNMTLHVEAGATILASEDPADYPLRAGVWGDSSRGISSLIYGENLVNVAITGRGTIDGQGEIWWERQRLRNPRPGRDPKPVRLKEPAEAEVKKIEFGRPHLIRLVRSKNVLIEGLTLVNSPSWTVNPVFCEFVTVTGITIVNPANSPNTDGINPESCRNVHISNCNIDVGDDCVTIKSGTDEVGRRVGRPCENITVTNCTMLHGHGGVVVGSEMSGGARNITVSNCVFQGTDRGIRIKSQRGRGGIVEGITVSNIVMQDVTEPFTITMFYHGSDTVEEKHAVDEGTPRFRDILINNVTARGAKSAGQVTGLKEMPIEGVTFSNVRIAAEKGFTCTDARNITFFDVKIDAQTGPAMNCAGAVVK